MNLYLLLLRTTAVVIAHPEPPLETPLQRALLKQARAVAQSVSAAATDEAIAFLSTPDFNHQLALLSPSLARLPPSELLSRWREEAYVSFQYTCVSACCAAIAADVLSCM